MESKKESNYLHPAIAVTALFKPLYLLCDIVAGSLVTSQQGGLGRKVTIVKWLGVCHYLSILLLPIMFTMKNTRAKFHPGSMIVTSSQIGCLLQQQSAGTDGEDDRVRFQRGEVGSYNDLHAGRELGKQPTSYLSPHL